MHLAGRVHHPGFDAKPLCNPLGGEHRFGWAAFQQMPAAQQHDPVGVLHRQVEVVEDREYAKACLIRQLSQKAEQLLFLGDVLAGGGLI